MEIREFQDLIGRMYSDKDRERGSAGTFLWLVEEIGELASAVSEGSQADKEEEFADVLAWLFTLANVENIDLTAAIAKNMVPVVRVAVRRSAFAMRRTRLCPKTSKEPQTLVCARPRAG